MKKKCHEPITVYKDGKPVKLDLVRDRRGRLVVFTPQHLEAYRAFMKAYREIDEADRRLRGRPYTGFADPPLGMDPGNSARWAKIWNDLVLVGLLEREIVEERGSESRFSAFGRQRLGQHHFEYVTVQFRPGKYTLDG